MLTQQILNGLITGSVYALFSLGFTLIFSVHRLLNLAHGGVFMLGAFVGYYAVISGVSIWVAALAGGLFAGVASLLVQHVGLRRLHRQPHHVVEFAALVTTLGLDLNILGILCQNLAEFIRGFLNTLEEFLLAV